MLTLSDYQKEALKTSDETNTLEYCVLGLVSEAGEVAGVVKKWLRGDYDEATMRAKMLDELGDVLWYVAVTADRAGVNDVSWPFRTGDEIGLKVARDGGDPVSSVVWLINRVNDVAQGLWGNIDESRLFPVFVNLATVTAASGHTLEMIAAHNVTKLRDRQQRGVIRGSGDGR